MSNASRCVTVFTQRSEHSCVSSVREFCCSDGDYDDDDSSALMGGKFIMLSMTCW